MAAAASPRRISKDGVRHMRTWIAGLALVGFLMTGVSYAADGKAVFDAKCASCHGAGKPKALAGIGKKGYDAAKLKTHPAFKKLSADEQKAVEEYLKKL